MVTPQYEKGKLYDIPITDLRSDPNQPRKSLDPQAMEELVASIKTTASSSRSCFGLPTAAGLPSLPASAVSRPPGIRVAHPLAFGPSGEALNNGNLVKSM